MTTLAMRIEGMNCAYCEKTIAEALTAAGGENVEARWRDGIATFEPGSTTDDQLRAVLERQPAIGGSRSRRPSQDHGGSSLSSVAKIMTTTWSSWAPALPLGPRPSVPPTPLRNRSTWPS